ncbi:MAG: aminotransferase class IV, partial [Patescibacteria group bacterium]
MNTEYCFLNGEILPLTEAKVGVEDIGILRGYAIYEGIAAIKGEPFRMGDHWQRFLDSAHALNLNIPITEDKTIKIIRELNEKNQRVERANVRIILTGGRAINGIEYEFENPTFYILVEKFEPLSKELYERGAKLITYNHLRFMPEHKTTHYITAVNLQKYRKEEEAVEILYVHDGEVLECATSNIFIIKDGKVITPAENILKGITRKVLLEIVAEVGLRQGERVVLESELREADEVFITSSFKDIVPIIKIDDYEIGNGKVGPRTADLMSQF